MPGYSDICLWLQTDKLNALKKALAGKELKLEDKLQEKLEEIYCVYVPLEQRREIDERLAVLIREEEEEAARRKAEQYRESVVRVIRNGQNRCPLNNRKYANYHEYFEYTGPGVRTQRQRRGLGLF